MNPFNGRLKCTGTTTPVRHSAALMNPTLKTSELLAATSRRYLLVPIPELGGRAVRLRNLTEAERSDYEAEVLDQRGKISRPKLAQAKRRLVVLTAVDDDGKQLFSGGSIDALSAVDGAIVGRLYDAAQRHCGFLQDAEAENEPLPNSLDSIDNLLKS
jgi:hypothetical protein